MKLDRFDATPAPAWRQFNVFCHAVLTDWSQLDELLAAQAAAQAEAGDAQCVICTLDDLRQCLYTSGHALEELDLLGDVDLPDEERDRQNFQALQQGLRAPDAPRWPQVLGQLAWDKRDLLALLQINQAPELVIDEVVYLMRMPTPHTTEAIAGLPNGYFSCDLDVLQNHSVIVHLAQAAPHLGWRLFGIGSSLLGFVRDAPLDEPQAQALVADLQALYGQDPELAGHAHWPALQATLTGKRTLFVGYTEGLSDWLSDDDCDGDGNEGEAASDA